MSASKLFADVDTNEFVAEYAVELQVRELIVGGVPSDPSVVRKWLEARVDLGDAAMAELLEDTLAARKVEQGPMSASEAVDVLMTSPQAPSVNGFKRLSSGELAYEGRCMKGALKEAMNSAYPGSDWPGKKDHPIAKNLRKGLKNYGAETIFVAEHMLGLGVYEPARIEERVKHVTGATGPRSIITVVEVVERPLIRFTLRVHEDFLPREAWAKLWTRAEDIGIGSDRARSDGKFDLVRFEKM